MSGTPMFHNPIYRQFCEGPTNMSAADHATEMAFAIQRFRNCELLKDSPLRGTPEYDALCRAWKNFVEDFPTARLNADAI